MMAVSCVGYLRSKARRAWRNCRTTSGRDAFGGYIAGERRLGMITRWTEFADADKCDERWSRNLVKGDSDGPGSLKSRFGPACVGMKCILADSGRMRRLLRSKS